MSTGEQTRIEELADNFWVVLSAYLAVGIPLNFYLYHDVIDKRWRAVGEVRTFSYRYGALACAALVLLWGYGYLQFVAGDYKEGGAAVLSCAIAVYGLYLRLRQMVILHFFRDHLQQRAAAIVSVYENKRMGAAHGTTHQCALMFPEGRYRQGPVVGHLSSVFLDDNYPGDGPRITWLQRKPVVKDWTEMMVRTGLWVRLAVLPSSLSFGTALHPKSIPSGSRAPTSVDKIVWTLDIARQQFLASGERRSTQGGPDVSLDTFIKCLMGEQGALYLWRETLSFAPESEWSQALSEFPSGWIEGLPAAGIAWEVYLALALHTVVSPRGSSSSDPPRSYSPRCAEDWWCLAVLCGRSGGVATPSWLQPPATRDVGAYNELKRIVERQIRYTVDNDGFVTTAVLMAGFPREDECTRTWLTSVQQLAGIWHRLAQSMTSGSVEMRFTLGVDLVVALALLLGADKLSFEFSQSSGQGMENALRERHQHVVSRLRNEEAEKVLRTSLERCIESNAQDSAIAQSHYSLGKFLHAKGQYDEARAQYDHAIQTWENTGDHKLVLVVTSKADMYMQQGDYPRADEIYRQAIIIRRAAQHPDELAIASLLHRQAESAGKQGNRDEAVSLFEQALAIRRQTLGDGHPDTVSTQHSIMLLQGQV